MGRASLEMSATFITIIIIWHKHTVVVLEGSMLIAVRLQTTCWQAICYSVWHLGCTATASLWMQVLAVDCRERHTAYPSIDLWENALNTRSIQYVMLLTYIYIHIPQSTTEALLTEELPPQIKVLKQTPTNILLAFKAFPSVCTLCHCWGYSPWLCFPCWWSQSWAPWHGRSWAPRCVWPCQWPVCTCK